MWASTNPARIVPLPAMTIFLPIVEPRNVRDAPMNSFLPQRRSRAAGVKLSGLAAHISAASAGCLVGHGVRHVRGTDPGVELLGGDIAELQRGLPQAEALMMGRQRDLRGLLVADARRERGHQHEAGVEVLLDARRVGLDAARAVLLE